MHAVNVAAEYDGLAKDLVYKLKFGGSRAAADAMVSLMDLSNLSRDAVIVYLPTSSGRARQRGFDQAQLLARALSRRAGLVHCSALSRLGESRQVGATRRQRLEQLQDSFLVRRPASIRSQPVILVDDVMTTGASLSVAAKVLKQAGAKRVEALVFARA